MKILTDEEVFVLVIVWHVFFLFDPKLWKETAKQLELEGILTIRGNFNW